MSAFFARVVRQRHLVEHGVHVAEQRGVDAGALASSSDLPPLQSLQPNERSRNVSRRQSRPFRDQFYRRVAIAGLFVDECPENEADSLSTGFKRRSHAAPFMASNFLLVKV
jgi:ABC-type uncharacterized transport system involved in gliding motility auxiliary subunit